MKTSDLPKEPVSSPLFTGTQVFRQLIVDPGESESFNFSIVAFSAGSRNKFHQHTSDQILIVTEGTGVVVTDQEERDCGWRSALGCGCRGFSGAATQE